MPRDRFVSLCLVVCIALFAMGGAFVLFSVPFPTSYDELQHVSFMAALREAPTLFPHYGSYLVLRDDLAGWSGARNYLAHPPLYYLLLAPFSGDVAVLRMINLAMAASGFALCAQAGVTLLTTPLQRCAFLLLLLVFSKPALIAGMVNNDNLVLLETGLLFWLVAQCSQHCHARGRGHPDDALDSRFRGNDSRGVLRSTGYALAIAILLALVGWTKFNAFVGLTFFVGLLHLFDIVARRQRLFGRVSWMLLAGALVGAIPTIANLATFGAPAWVPVDFLFVEPVQRQPYDFAAFAAAFWQKVGLKIFYIDGVVNLLPIIAGIAALSLCAIVAARSRLRDIALSAILATVAFAALHTIYGWNSFRTLGSMSDAQSRYYVMLWPMLAVAAVIGCSAVRVVASEAKQSVHALRLNGSVRRSRSQ